MSVDSLMPVKLTGKYVIIPLKQHAAAELMSQYTVAAAKSSLLHEDKYSVRKFWRGWQTLVNTERQYSLNQSIVQKICFIVM